MYPRVPPTILESRFFDILLFSNFTKCAERAKNSYILPKMALLEHFGSRKIGKKQNNKKAGAYDCSRDPKVHLYLVSDQLSHFPQTSSDFRR